MVRTGRFGLFAVGLMLLLAGVVSWWRASHPPLTASQQITANLDEATQALQNRSTAGILRHIAPGFSWNNNSKKELGDLLRGAMFQWRDVQLQRSGEVTVVNGTQATTTGSYMLRYRAGPKAPRETSSGNYKLQWQMQDGNWKIVKADGGEAAMNAQ